MPVIPGDPAAPATKRISVTTFFLVQKTVPKGPVSSKPLPGGYGAPFNPFGLSQPRWPVPIPRPSTFSIAAALSVGNENRDTSTPVPKEADFAENDVETPTEPAAVETSADAPSGSDSEEDHPPRKRVRIFSPAAPQARPTGTPRVAIAPMSSTMMVQTASASAPSSSKRTASTSPSPAPSPKKARPPQQLRRKVDTRSARQKRQDATVPTGKRAFHRTVDAAVAANPFPAAPPPKRPKPPTSPQASSSGVAAASSSAAAAMPPSPGLYGGGSTVKYEDDFTKALKKEVMFRRANMEIDPPAEDFLD